MDFKHLNIFVTIADCGTLTAASEVLHIAQSALSRHLQNMEEDYGALLMRRSARRVELTDEGKLLYRYAKEVLRWSDSIRREIYDLSTGMAGTLRLGSTPNLLSQWLKDVFPLFHTRFPSVKFEIYEGESHSLLAKLRKGLCDIAIVRTPIDMEGLDTFYVGTDPLVACYLGGRYFQDCGAKIKISYLNGIPLFINRWWYAQLYPLCAANGFLPDILAISDNIFTSLNWAERLPGCAIVTLRALEQFGSPSFHYKIIDEPALTTGNAVVTVKDRYLPTAAQNFLEMLLPTL